MKLNNLLLLFCLGLLTQTAWATDKSVNTEDIAKGLVAVEDLAVDEAPAAKALTKKELRKQKRALKKQQRMEKRMERFSKILNKKMTKKAVDFSDPVDKWLWFALFAWGAAILLWILAAATITGGGFGILYLLATLVSLFGTVSFIIWLINKFG